MKIRVGGTRRRWEARAYDRASQRDDRHGPPSNDAHFQVVQADTGVPVGLKPPVSVAESVNLVPLPTTTVPPGVLPIVGLAALTFSGAGGAAADRRLVYERPHAGSVTARAFAGMIRPAVLALIWSAKAPLTGKAGRAPSAGSGDLFPFRR